MKLLLTLVLVPLMGWSSSLETCYRVFFLFLPVARSCVEYIREGDRITVKSWAKTVVVGRLVKRVNSWGEAHIVSMKPRLFLLFQREGSYVRDHRYTFRSDGVEYSIVRHRKEGKEVREGFYRSGHPLYDPFSVSLIIYVRTPSREEEIPMFYDEKVRGVRYRTIGEEDVDVFGKVYRTWKVIFRPEIETKGLLKPRGVWYAWIDKETNIPVRLKVSFTVGTVYVYLEGVKGNRKLLREIKDEQTGVLSEASGEGAR